MRRCRLRRVWEVNGFHLESCREVRIASTGGAYGWLSNFEAHGLRLVCNFPFRSFLFTMEFSDGIGMRGISRVQGRSMYVVWNMEAVRTFFSNEFDECRPPFFVYLSLKSEKNMMKEKLVFVTNDDICHSKRYSGAPRGRTQVRPGGRHCARNAAERYESGDNDQ